MKIDMINLRKIIFHFYFFFRKTFWRDIVKNIWPQFFVYPLYEKYYEPLSMSEIVTQPWAAGYYSHIWSKMIAADVYSAFEDEDADSVAIGMRLA